MTIKQKQCLLAYLGYYTDNIDGLWGKNSIHALTNFQSDYGCGVDGIWGNESEKRILEVVASGEKPGLADVQWDTIKYFDKSEMKCKCGGKYCDGFPVNPKQKLMDIADRVREHFENKMYISSGIRCEVHNDNVHGVSTSRHKLGKAIDFRIEGFSAETVLAYVKAQSDIRYAYAIDKNYVHMDIE